jgi:hypothetical protein
MQRPGLLARSAGLAGVVDRLPEMVNALLGTAPVDEVEADDRVQPGQRLGLASGKIEPLDERRLCRGAPPRQRVDVAEFAQGAGGDEPDAGVPGRFERLPQDHRALIVEAPRGVDKRGAQFEQRRGFEVALAGTLGGGGGAAEAIEAGIDGAGVQRRLAGGDLAFADRPGRDAERRGGDGPARGAAQCVRWRLAQLGAELGLGGLDMGLGGGVPAGHRQRLDQKDMSGLGEGIEADAGLRQIDRRGRVAR